jgi:signal transduction histidine kinase
MQALRAKDEFVASVSHELRTPLTSIIGYLDLTSEYEDELPAEVNRNLDVVARNAERLLLLVSDLLTTVQSEAGTVQLSVQPTDLAELVQLSIDAAGPRLHDAQVRVSANLLPLPPVSVDPGHFAQVVENLLSNSIKYTPGGGTIEIGLEQAGREVLLIVRDDGIGISAEDQEQMFTRFFRASTAMERAIPGVGLGLVITKAIVEGHGGTVEVFSEEGVGTTVRVRLPLEPLEAHVVDPPSAVPAGADWPLSAGHA